MVERHHSGLGLGAEMLGLEKTCWASEENGLGFGIGFGNNGI